MQNRLTGKFFTQRGFTLLELLVVITIIGLLSSIGYVSYQAVKVSARDAKRVSDAKQVQTALELFFEFNTSYPSDNVFGSDGQLLGYLETRRLSDAGFSDEVFGTPYMVEVPKNPEPGGTDYVYRSLYTDGRDCQRQGECESYAVLFTLEGRIGSLQPGPHALTPDGIAGEEGGGGGLGITGPGGILVGLSNVQDLAGQYTLKAGQLVRDIQTDERVETTANIAAPSIAALALANVAFTVYSSTSLASLLIYLFTQPLLLFGGRKRKAWGIVYNSLSKLPVDLAIVRVIDAMTGQRVKTAATDHEGRFSFLLPGGTYRLEVAKIGYTHPSQYIVDVTEDGQYQQVLCGQGVTVPSDGGLLIPNIPIDPVERDESDRIVIRRNRSRNWRQNVAVLSPALGALAFLAQPNLLTGGLFVAQLLAYSLFKRLAMTKESRQWGFVYEKGIGKAVPKAVLRVFALPYHKMVDTQVTDGHGRYHFRVGGGLFYLTSTRAGYEKTESEPLDLRDRKEPAIIVTSIPMLRSQGTNDQPKKTAQTAKSGLIVGPGVHPIQNNRATGQLSERKNDSLDDLLPPAKN
ncbi:MAG: carboxypeptidase regulatory-like domain-containing protein [Patescibacteria group bacterium]